MPGARLLAGFASLAIIAIVTHGWVGGSTAVALAMEQDPTPTPTADPFLVAEALANLGLRSDAAAAAKKAIAANPLRSLGPKTLEAIAAPSASPAPSGSPDPFLIAERLAEAGLRSDAMDAAKTALKADPVRTLGPAVSAILSKPFAEALALAAAGFDEAALAAAKQQLQQHPMSSFPPQLAYLNQSLLHDPSVPELRYKAVGIAIQDALVILAVFLLAWSVLTMLQRILIRRVMVKAFEEEEVQDGSKLGKTLSVVVEDELRSLKSEGGSSSLKLTRTPDAPLSIPEAVKQLPGQAGLVAALVSIIPTRVYGFIGTLHPEGERGVGLTAAITDPVGAIKTSQTFWEKTYDPLFKTGDPAKRRVPVVTAYRRLAIAAASWAIYQDPLVPEGLPPPGYMSAKWRSYALHRVAASWHDEGDVDRARQLYQQALESDSANWGTLLNLASLQQRDAEGRARSIELLLEAKRLTESQRADMPVDRSWHRIRFVLGILLLEDELLSPQHGNWLQWLLDAEQCAISVIAQADADVRRPQSNDRAMFLSAMRDSAVSLLAGIWERMQLRDSELPKSAAELPEPYNEAAAGMRLASGLVALLKNRTGSFDALPADVRYDLASYFSLAGTGDPTKFDDALAHLRYGVKRADEARNDLALRPLRMERPGPFDQVLSRWAEDAVTSQPPIVPLEKIPLIGAGLAERLKARGIENVERLQQVTRTEADRHKLATDLGIAFALVDEWTNVLRLRFLHGAGVDVRVASLLYAIGIRHPDALATKDPIVLAQELRAANNAQGILEQEPTTTEIHTWVECARGALG